jgi:TatD DNase family protein
MIDSHCHIDLYSNPMEVADRAERAGILTVMVTNLPSAFDRAYPHVQNFKYMRLALGLHPLTVNQHFSERRRFVELVDKTSFIGEIGLDFSRAGYGFRESQIESFKFVLASLNGKPKFITLHSRRAESTVLSLLHEEQRSPVVFHWYSGPLKTLELALSRGHYFSINPAMITSPNGQKIISRLPPDRVLTESDGPFVTVDDRVLEPRDVVLVENYLASLWRVNRLEVRRKLKENFVRMLRPIISVRDGLEAKQLS